MSSHKTIPASAALRSQSSSDHLQPRSHCRQYPAAVRYAEDLIDKLPAKAAIVARIQMLTGARAIEVLQLCWKDVHRGGWIYVRAGKKSTKRAVYIGELLTRSAARDRDPESLVFGPLSYWQYYRLCLDAAGSSLPRTHQRRRVTNLFRAAAAELVRALAEGSPEAAQHLLGHKSTRSTRYYLKPQGASNG